MSAKVTDKVKCTVPMQDGLVPIFYFTRNIGVCRFRSKRLSGNFNDTFRQQVYITTSGFFTQPPLKIALDTFGIDNILFSVGYPFSTNEMGLEFLNAIPLPDEQKTKIAHGSAGRLLNLKP